MMKLGLLLATSEIKALGRNPSYRETREMALQAEEMGFDSIWLFDHLLYQVDEKSTIGVWEAWTFLSALAEATKKVEIGNMVLCSPFRNPAILAKMAHTIDEVSGGRFILGIGAGWHQAEFDAFGVPFDHLYERFEEAIQIIHPLLKHGQVDFEGKYYRAHECDTKPLSPRKGGPPLLIGSGLGPRMLKLTAKYADMWNTPYTSNPETLNEPLNKLRSAFAEEGRRMDSVGVTALVMLHYPDLGELRQGIDNPVVGSVEEIARTIEAYEQQGVSHMVFQCVQQYNQQAIQRLAESISLSRRR